MDERFANHEPRFHELLAFLARIPAVATNDTPSGGFGTGASENGCWWIKLRLRQDHPLAWSTVQELGHVLNYLSPEQRLPTVFLPVSPPPYLNGGPEYLSWVIESKQPDFSPSETLKWLAGRLPSPVEDAGQWPVNQCEQPES